MPAAARDHTLSHQQIQQQTLPDVVDAQPAEDGKDDGQPVEPRVGAGGSAAAPPARAAGEAAIPQLNPRANIAQADQQAWDKQLSG